MSSLKPRLEAIRDELAPSPDAFDRLTRRRARKHRRHRVAVGALALALAAAGVTVVTRAFIGGGHQPASSPVVGPVDARVAGDLPIDFATSAASGFGSVWIAQSANDGSNTGWIHRIDPSTGQTIARIPIDTIPSWEVGGGAMATGAESLWVGGAVDRPDEPGLPKSDAAVTRIDPETNSVIAVMELGGDFAADLGVDATGVWVSLFGDDGMEVVRLDPEAGTVTARIPMESSYARDLFVVDGTIWLRERKTHDSVVGGTVLTQIDPATNSIARSVDLGGRVGSMTVFDGAIWAQRYGYEEGDSLLQIDPHTGTQVGEPVHYDGELNYIAGGEGGIWGVTALDPPASLVRIEVSSGTADAEVELDREEEPIDVVVGPASVWILDYVDSVIWVELEPA
jgi:hypothetical protein